MLSNVDIIREMGKNIAIYPFYSDTIKGSSVNLRASDLAWSMKTKRSAIKRDAPTEKEYIELLPNDTTLIETEEIVAASMKISGTYHSRVRITSRGTGHIGTTLNPGWVGQSLIAIHNHTNESQRIEIGEHFVTLMFFYLNSKSTIPEENKSSRADVLNKYGIKLTPEESDKIFEKPEIHDLKKLFDKMKALPEYKEIKNLNKKRINLWYIAQISIAFILVAMMALPCIPEFIKTISGILFGGLITFAAKFSADRFK